MQICTLTQTHNHDSIPPLSFFTGRMPFLPPNQQHQITEGNNILHHFTSLINNTLLNINNNKAKRQKKQTRYIKNKKKS